MLPSSILRVKLLSKISFRLDWMLVLAKMSRLSIKKYLTAPILLTIISAIPLTYLSAFAKGDARLSMIDEEPLSFAKCWAYSSAVDLETLPVTDGANVYFLNPENRIEALDLHNASKLWSTEMGGSLVSNILVADTALFVVTNAAQGEPSCVP